MRIVNSATSPHRLPVGRLVAAWFVVFVVFFPSAMAEPPTYHDPIPQETTERQKQNPSAEGADWRGHIRKVHAKFTGRKGTFAQFGDSITVTMAFWTPLQYA